MEKYLTCGTWENGHDIGEGIRVFMRWSRKPKQGGQARGYKDYFEKLQTYVQEVGGQAEAKRPGILKAARASKDPRVISSSRFAYIDTNAYRHGTRGIESRIEDEIVAVIGVGGTGSYLVDILAKTNIKELHLFDDDVMKIHNAFRVAGAARVGELNGNKSKLEWHRERYAVVRVEGLHLHQMKVADDNLSRLSDYTTVFIAVDDLEVRRMVQRACVAMGVLHVSVGIGLELEGPNDDQIGGMVKIETDFDPGIPREHIPDVSENGEPDANDVYSSNIQTSELNMLGAALAIVEWKEKRGIYRDERDHDADTTIYSVTTGEINVGKKGA